MCSMSTSWTQASVCGSQALLQMASASRRVCSPHICHSDALPPTRPSQLNADFGQSSTPLNGG